jgi:hypothetical protein
MGAESGAVFGRDVAQLANEIRQRTFAAEQANAQLLDLGLARSAVEGCQGLAMDTFKLVFHRSQSTRSLGLQSPVGHLF